MTDLERAQRVAANWMGRDDPRGFIDLIANALAAARREDAEEMRERAAQRAENLWFDARDTEWDEGVNCAKRRVAHAIRALPLTPEESK